MGNKPDAAGVVIELRQIKSLRLGITTSIGMVVHVSGHFPIKNTSSKTDRTDNPRLPDPSVENDDARPKGFTRVHEQLAYTTSAARAVHYSTNRANPRIQILLLRTNPSWMCAAPTRLNRLYHSRTPRTLLKQESSCRKIIRQRNKDDFRLMIEIIQGTKASSRRGL